MCSHNALWTLCGERGKGWSVLLLESVEAKRERMCSLTLLVYPAASKEGSEERARMVSMTFYVAHGGDLGNLNTPFSIATTRCRGGRYSFLWIAPLTLDAFLIMLSVKQEGIKYHLLSLWYDWD